MGMGPACAVAGVVDCTSVDHGVITSIFLYFPRGAGDQGRSTRLPGLHSPLSRTPACRSPLGPRVNWVSRREFGNLSCPSSPFPRLSENEPLKEAVKPWAVPLGWRGQTFSETPGMSLAGSTSSRKPPGLRPFCPPRSPHPDQRSLPVPPPAPAAMSLLPSLHISC
jgi:hypothetical protein